MPDSYTEKITPRGPGQEAFTSSTYANTHAKTEQNNDAALAITQGTNTQNLLVDEQQNGENAGNIKPEHKIDDKPYSVFTHNEKKIIVLCAGLSQFFSPISGQIYFPSLDAISDLFGIAPAFVGGFSVDSGRRPTYLICFVIYVAANIGLALQNNYAALMVLRCLQSAGGSGTVALASAVVSDIVTSQERGVYVSYMSVVPQAGPSLGPIIGGLLGQYLGWHSVFWFLLICTGVVAIPVALFFPETCRKVVDDGSVPPPRWSRSYLNTNVEKRLIAEG
ncbi:hypothetical protein BP5796_10840 [Coleophoma crateriformis]|uniref:Major facilitator superfamily (MFS) profile domain-containing protein n=1 Tax=Coleophoma crateriformis TaxID=565419 RepID=A0A3D8QLF1_9HELO|nr:hypothetical protein BP5796_10840 [Coleophoma crateriformis]